MTKEDEELLMLDLAVLHNYITVLSDYACDSAKKQLQGIQNEANAIQEGIKEKYENSSKS